MTQPLSFSRREVNFALLASAFAAALRAPPPVMAPATVAVPLFDFAIAGGDYHGLAATRTTLVSGTALDLRREADNPYDRDAIAVHDGAGTMLGYVPRGANGPVARLLDAGRAVRAEVVARLRVRREEDIPDDLVFTGFFDGDPMIRLTLEDAAPA